MSTFQGEMKVSSRVRVRELDEKWTAECRKLLSGKVGTVEAVVQPMNASTHRPLGGLRYLVGWDAPVKLHPNTQNTGFWFEARELEAP